MIFKDYNDFYLIYLIKEMKSEVALNIMFEKYTIFIRKKIISFKIRENDKEDFLQEGLLCLNKALQLFEDSYRKTFFKYFELILTRRFITLKNDLIKKNFTLIEEYAEEKDERVNVLAEEVSLYRIREIVKNFSSEIEKNIYVKYFIEDNTVENIANKFNYNQKTIYNAINRIKIKLKKNLKE